MVPLAGAATSKFFCHNKHVFVMTNHVFCCDKNMLAATKLLLQQNYFVTTKLFCQQARLWRQKYAYCDKTFVVTKLCLLWQIFVLVTTNKFLSWQAYFCHNERWFVMTNMCLLWHVCHNKTFVTKIILVAALANIRMDVGLNEWTDKPISLFICFLCSRPLPTHPYSNASSPKLCSLCWWCAMCLWKKPWRLLTKCLTSVTMTLSRWGDDPGKIHVTPTEHCWKDSTMGTANSSGHNCEGVLEFTPFVCISTCFFVFCF